MWCPSKESVHRAIGDLRWWQGVVDMGGVAFWDDVDSSGGEGDALSL